MDDVEIGENMALLVDDEARPGAGRGLVTEETGDLGLGRDVDDALVGRVIDPNVVPLVGIEILEHVFGRRRAAWDRDRRGRRRACTERPGTGTGGGCERARPRIWAKGGRRPPERSPKKTKT